MVSSIFVKTAYILLKPMRGICCEPIEWVKFRNVWWNLFIIAICYLKCLILLSSISPLQFFSILTDTDWHINIVPHFVGFFIKAAI
jgi:hypothetical protein